MGRRVQGEPPRFTGFNTTGVPTWVFVVTGVTVVAICGICGYLLTQLFDDSDAKKAPPVQLDRAASARSAPAVTASASPRPSATQGRDTLVANAQRIKPLENIEKGDRVIYQGHVCTWQLWNKNINTSTIKCPGSKAFQIQTGRLTPVELKDGPSKLKVKH